MTIRRREFPTQGADSLRRWRDQILSRRAFLLRVAGGSLAAMFPLRFVAAEGESGGLDDDGRWQIIGAVQDHLFPSEPEVPGAREINALSYLQWVVSDENLTADHRAFLLRGAEWVQDKALGLQSISFLEADEQQRETILRAVAEDGAGNNWLSTVLLYVFEALLTDPAYGGNPDGIGWKWLGHTPGFPRPTAHKRYGVS